GYVADTQRINRQVERITRGLYFHERGQPLGLTCLVRTYNESLIDWQRMDARAIRAAQQLIGAVSHVPAIKIGRAFEYGVIFPDPDQRYSIWWLTFYER